MKTNLQNTDISTTTMKNDRDVAVQDAASEGTIQEAPGASADMPQNVSDDMPLVFDSAAAVSGRSLEEIISDAADQELAQYPSVTMTPEKLEAMVAKRKAEREAVGAVGAAADGDTNGLADESNDRNANEPADEIAEKTAGGTTRKVASKSVDETSAKAAGKPARKNRALRIAGLAAILMLALLGGLLLLNTLTTDVGANKNEKEEIKTEDGVIIEDGGYGAVHEESSVLEITNWEEIPGAKEAYPDLKIPDYVPAEYNFERLTIEYVAQGATICEYLFINSENESLEIEEFITNEFETSTDLDSIIRLLNSERGTVYIQETDNKIATIQLDDGCLIKIWCDISDDEIIRIIDNMED